MIALFTPFGCLLLAYLVIFKHLIAVVFAITNQTGNCCCCSGMVWSVKCTAWQCIYRSTRHKGKQAAAQHAPPPTQKANRPENRFWATGGRPGCTQSAVAVSGKARISETCFALILNWLHSLRVKLRIKPLHRPHAVYCLNNFTPLCAVMLENVNVSVCNVHRKGAGVSVDCFLVSYCCTGNN